VVRFIWIQGKSQHSIDANLDYYIQKIREAKSSAGDTILLPELFLTDYFCIEERQENFDLAIDLNAQPIKVLRELAKDLQVNLSIPFFEKRSSAIYYNSILIIDIHGELVCHYRKLHIPDDPGFSEKYYFTPGDLGFQVAKLQNYNLGLLICWDQWFPEAARLTSMKGADVLYYPTAIGWDDNEDPAVYQSQVEAWITIMRSHAIANNVYVIAVNRVGREGHLQFWGNSFCCDPYGNIVHRDATDEVISTVELDLSKISEARKIWPYFRDRRVDVYSSLTEKWLS
jgi:N-carbamoylputrescine amidase